MVLTQAPVKGVAASVHSLLPPVALTTATRGCVPAAGSTISEVVLGPAGQGLNPQQHTYATRSHGNDLSTCQGRGSRCAQLPLLRLWRGHGAHKVSCIGLQVQLASSSSSLQRQGRFLTYGHIATGTSCLNTTTGLTSVITPVEAAPEAAESGLAEATQLPPSGPCRQKGCLYALQPVPVMTLTGIHL